MPADSALEAVAALRDPVRRALYRYVSDQSRPVGRVEAADAVGIGRALASFHLDRLAAEGLLEVEYRRLSGRTGPGAGRPSKLYRRTGREIAVTVPPRRYDLAAHILADAVERGESPRVVARRYGRELWHSAATQGNAGERILALLAAFGFAPVDEGGVVRLRNCPFHALAHEHMALVCGMNLALLEGMLSALPEAKLDARLDPRPEMCCVALYPGRQPEGI